MYMSNDLKLKSINEILKLEYNFFIPSYQRGYRWDNRQILDLLDDIYEFANKTKVKNEFYCLQPVVVRKDDNYYRVIDGQQRLTTIYIILKYLKESSEKFQSLKDSLKDNEIFEFCDIENFEVPRPYSIEYETRKGSKDFLENNLSKNTDDSNPDYFYMSKAYETIKNWFKNKNKKLFLDTLLNDTKVIWYEVHCEDYEDEIEIFTRLNVGKIQLTNAELIKAMLLLPIENYKEKIEFSSIWDEIEQSLQNNDFWYFLSNDLKSETAIDLIFNLLAQKYQKEYNKGKEDKLNFKPIDDKYAYYIFAHILKSNFKTEKEIWKDSRGVYRTLLNWYNDREMYHKIAYLIHFNYNLLDLYTGYENKTKDVFKCELFEFIKKRVQGINLRTLKYKKDAKKVHRVLLLFNIETILQNHNSNARFDFFHFKFIEQTHGEVKKRKWDIEHIASQTDKENKEEWVKAVFRYIFGRDVNEHKEKIKKLAGNKFDKFQARIKKVLKIQEPAEELKDNIGNLTLLDSKTNRSYGNAFFPVKRAIIIQEDSSGNFIPICTKNIFLKQYSKKLSDMMNWTDEDIKSYRNEIYKTLECYGITCKEVESDG